MRKEFNEALGVPENQIDTAIKIYERILKIIPKDYDVSDLKDFKKKFRGDFKVGDVTFSTVEFEIEDTSDDYGPDYRVNCNGIFFEGVDITDILSNEQYQELVDDAHADWRE